MLVRVAMLAAGATALILALGTMNATVQGTSPYVSALEDLSISDPDPALVGSIARDIGAIPPSRFDAFGIIDWNRRLWQKPRLRQYPEWSQSERQKSCSSTWSS